jgi:hypothetical protein
MQDVTDKEAHRPLNVTDDDAKWNILIIKRKKQAEGLTELHNERFIISIARQM